MELNIHQRYLIEEFADEYHEHRLPRRELLRRVLLITGSVPVTASALMALGCGSDDEEATSTPAASGSSPTMTATQTAAATVTAAAGPQVGPDDPAVGASDIRFPGPESELLAYIARPSADGTYPGVLVIHENRGLTDHFRDVSRRYAKEGFAALAIDLVSRDGGTKPDAGANSGFLGNSPPPALTADLHAGLEYLKSQEYVNADALGVTGFCFGGGYTWETAVASAEVRAAVPYYGTAPLDRLADTNAAILAIYGETDSRITPQAEEVRARLEAAGKTVEIKIYPGAGHAFFNDTGGNYNASAAADAWASTLAWFRQYLVV